MAQPHCEKHKRYVPYCDGCKAVVAAAKEREESEELQAEVGFPGADRDELDPGGTVEGHGGGDELEGTPSDEEYLATLPDEPVEGDELPEGFWERSEVKDAVEAEKQPPDPEGPLQEGAPGPDAPTEIAELDLQSIPSGHDDDPPDDEPRKGCEECGGKCQGHADKGGAELDIPPSLADVVRTLLKAADEGHAVTLLIGEDAEEELRVEGRREVIKMVREYFSDSVDTVAFQLLEYLEKKCQH